MYCSSDKHTIVVGINNIITMDSECFICVNINLVIALYQRTLGPAQQLAVDNKHGLTAINKAHIPMLSSSNE
jgi:hypothetical protein